MIISVSQGYEFIESQHEYKISIEITYEERDILIDIRKAKDNFDKDGRLRYFNCSIYRHMVKEC